MEPSVLDMAAAALGNLFEPMRLLALVSGVLLGLIIGVIPGIGGLAGMALLLPVAMEMEPYSSFAFLIGMAAVTTTSDTIPAVLVGVPGTVGSAATVLDGHPLAKQGQAGRAFGAAYMASMLGGLSGALLLALCIPIMRPVVLALGSPELFAICILGLSMVAALSGVNPLKGLIAAGLGLLIALIGPDPQIGTLRWTFDALYLWDGLPLIPIALGLFAIPELAEMAIRGTSIASGGGSRAGAGRLAGIKDVFKNWWLVLRCSWIGSALGAVPGVGAPVIDWVAYGHAANTEKNAEGFGSGDIRGVIASESSNNAKEGGALIPTLAFGVPGSAPMAILLGAFLIHGLVPGPEMLTTRLDITYTIVWSLALANVLGTGVCLAFSNQLARIAEIRIGVLLPLVLAIIAVAAYQGSRQWGDLYLMVAAGAFGWTMKLLSWPRAPLILGVVLGGLIERYLFISVSRSEWAWLANPLVIVFLGLALSGICLSTFRNARTVRLANTGSTLTRPRLSGAAIFSTALVIVLAVALYDLLDWRFATRIVPQLILTVVLPCTVVVMLVDIFVARVPRPDKDSHGAHTVAMLDEFPPRKLVRETAAFFAMVIGLVVAIKLLGMFGGIFLATVLAARLWSRESVVTALLMAGGMTLFTWGVFGKLLSVPWPYPLIAEWFPEIQAFVR